MFAAQLLAPSSDLALLLWVAPRILVWTVFCLTGCYLLSRLPKRFAVAVVAALIVAVIATVQANAQLQVPGLNCCPWVPLVWLCFPCW